MATSVKSRIDVAVSPYMEVATENDQPSFQTAIKSSAFPSGYFGGGSFDATIDDDNNVTITTTGVVALSGDGAVGAAIAISSIARKGILILKNSGFTSSAKDTASHASSIVRISTTNATDDSTSIVDLASGDVFAIPYTSKNFSTYFAINENTSASKPVYLEVTTIDNGE